MANEDEITANTIEVPRSDMSRLIAKMAEEFVCMKNRVSRSTGSGGSAGNFAACGVPNSCWSNIRGTGITLEEAKSLVSLAKARLKQDDMSMFEWDLIDRDQGIFDTKMMVFLWFEEEVTLMVRKRVQNDLQQEAIFIGVMREYAKLPQESFDIRWVDSNCVCRKRHRAVAP